MRRLLDFWNSLISMSALVPGLYLLLSGVSGATDLLGCLEGLGRVFFLVEGVFFCGWEGGPVDFLAVGCLVFLYFLTGEGVFLLAWLSSRVEWVRKPQLILSSD